MQTVVETPSYLAAAKASGITEAIRSAIVTMVAEDPTRGAELAGREDAANFELPDAAKGKAGATGSSTSTPAPISRSSC